MSQPLVSAIIPAYNRPQQTQRAINSVIRQTYEPIEIVIVDDGSDPPLQNKLSIPESAIENTVFKRHCENRGGNVARNTGIESASGEYLAFLDSDDEWADKKVFKQVGKLVESNSHLSYTGVKQLDSNGDLNAIKKVGQREDILEDLLTGNLIGTFSSIMINADVVERVGKPDPSMPCWQDWEWYLRLAAKGVEFTAVEEPLTIRHNEGEQISRSYVPKRDEAYPVIKKRIDQFASSPEQKRAGIAYLDFELGYSALANQHYSEARRLFVDSIRRYPNNKQFYLYLACTGPHYPAVQYIKRVLVRAVK